MLTFTFTHVARSGWEFEIKVPAKRVVCPKCDGTGTTLCDGLYGVAFSSEEFFEDPDFASAYYGGHYDVKCDHCHGNNVVIDPDAERMTKRQKFLFEHFMDRTWNDRMEAAHYERLKRAGIEF